MVALGAPSKHTALGFGWLPACVRADSPGGSLPRPRRAGLREETLALPTGPARHSEERLSQPHQWQIGTHVQKLIPCPGTPEQVGIIQPSWSYESSPSFNKLQLSETFFLLGEDTFKVAILNKNNFSSKIKKKKDARHHVNCSKHLRSNSHSTVKETLFSLSPF